MHRILLALVAALLLFTVSCSKVSKSNFQKIEGNMSYAEVEKILGEPDTLETAGAGPLSASTAGWKGTDGTISIQFVNDKVKVRRFLEPQPED